MHRMCYRYDLVLSRDALQHNSLESIHRILDNFARSDAKLFLIGSYPPTARPGTAVVATPSNQNIATGAMFAVDLARPPFSLAPMAVHAEGTQDRKHLYLYNRSALAAWSEAHANVTLRSLASQSVDRSQRHALRGGFPKPRINNSQMHTAALLVRARSRSTAASQSAGRTARTAEVRTSSAWRAAMTRHMRAAARGAAKKGPDV
jgi:hypothetical protein